MDAAILHERLAAAEGALIAMDERLDAQPQGQTEALVAYEARMASLEETLRECLTRLQLMETAQTEASIRMAEAVADEAEAQAREAEAVADTMEAIVPETVEPEVEVTDQEIVELEPETENENEAVPEKSTSWWENLFALR